jgi:hypothetical protein
MSNKGPDLFDRLEIFWGELVRRRVVHVAGVYAIASWIAVYMVATTYEKLFLPDAVFLTLVALTFLGFPVVLVLAWYFRLGRGGMRWRRVGAADEGAYGDSRSPGTPRGGPAGVRPAPGHGELPGRRQSTHRRGPGRRWSWRRARWRCSPSRT